MPVASPFRLPLVVTLLVALIVPAAARAAAPGEIPEIHRSMLERLPDARPALARAGAPVVVCWAEGTDLSLVRVFDDAVRGISPFSFNDTDRWSRTATDGSGLAQGDPTTLTWGIVPDGTSVPGYNGEPSAPSNLIAFLDGKYGAGPGGADLTQRPWFPIVETVFAEWSAVIGVTYVYEPADDGASLGGSSGALGVRADVRLSGHAIDGNNNILAYNFFPNNGDMVLDTSDSYFSVFTLNSRRLRNVMAHEHGHGLGLAHVCPVTQTKLMEPTVATTYDGPQHDDILAGNRGYGDPDEKPAENDTPAAATSLGAPDPGVPVFRNSPSIDDDGDLDVFSFEVPGGATLAVTVYPAGWLYASGPQNSNGTCPSGTGFNSAAQSDLAFEVLDGDGTTVLTAVDAGGLGSAESLTGFPLGGAGTRYVRVTGAQNAAQLYTLRVQIDLPAIGPVLEVAPAAILFTGVAWGDTACETVVIRNTGDQPLSVTGVDGCPDAGFLLDLAGTAGTVAAGDSTLFRVCFTPLAAAADPCTISVTTPDSTAYVSVTVGTVTGIGETGREIPGPRARLAPNPFGDATRLRFSIPAAAAVSAAVFDVRGRRVRTLLAGASLSAGDHDLDWDGRDDRGGPLAAGIYFVTVSAGPTRATIRAVRLR